MQAICRRIAEDNDPTAFTIFFRTYHPKLLRFARLFVRSNHQAEDVVSDAMVQLLKRRQSIFRMKKLEGYLFMSIKHQALNQMKKKQVALQDDVVPFEQATSVTDKATPLQQLLDSELCDRIQRATEGLPPRRQTVYRLIKDEGLRYRQVAKRLGISERTVEHHLEAAMKDLRCAVQEYWAERKPPPVADPLRTNIISSIA